MTRLGSFLRRHKRIALDTSIFIYQLEANPKYVALTEAIFEWASRSGSLAITSTLTMLELLVHPYRESNQQAADEYYALLSTYPNLLWIAPDLAIADVAARIRATHRLRTPDALQAACAVSTQATGFITNDSIFERVDAFETLVLNQVLL